MMVVHGTGDQVMPYAGQNFLNPKALEHADDYWTSIDPTASVGPLPTSRTYTADIARYVERLSSRVFHCAGFDETPFGWRPLWRWAGGATPVSTSLQSGVGITCGRGTQ
jgi:hypothetical protein